MASATIKRVPGGWVCRPDDAADRAELVDLFGTEWIPTPHTSQATAEDVIRDLTRGGYYANVRMSE